MYKVGTIILTTLFLFICTFPYQSMGQDDKAAKARELLDKIYIAAEKGEDSLAKKLIKELVDITPKEGHFLTELRSIMAFTSISENLNSKASDDVNVYLYQLLIDTYKKPTSRSIWYQSRGDFYRTRREFKNSINDYENAIRLEPQGHSVKELSWLLSTCPDAKYRDGKRALGYAQKWQNNKKLVKYDIDKAEALDVLAASYAELGDFQKAIETQREALTIMQNNKTKIEWIINNYEKRLLSYESGKPWRDNYKSKNR